jgi:hypothetical protein
LKLDFDFAKRYFAVFGQLRSSADDTASAMPGQHRLKWILIELATIHGLRPVVEPSDDERRGRLGLFSEELAEHA